MAFTKLSSLIFNSAKKVHLEDEARALLVTNSAKTVISEIFSHVSTSLEKLITSVYFTKNTLYINATNSSVHHELHLRREDLLQDINKQLPGEWVKYLRISVR